MRPDDFVCLEPCRLFLLVPDVIIGPGGPMGHWHPYNCSMGLRGPYNSSMGAHEAREYGRRRACGRRDNKMDPNHMYMVCCFVYIEFPINLDATHNTL